MWIQKWDYSTAKGMPQSVYTVNIHIHSHEHPFTHYGLDHQVINLEGFFKVAHWKVNRTHWECHC